MSSIPVRRTTRVIRSTKDNENANARPSRIATSRAKTALGGGGATTATSATTRAMASTAASKAKAVAAEGSKEETGVKRKREVLVEVTGLVTNNKLKDNTAVPGAKGKEVEKPKETVVKPKPVIKPPGKRLVASVAARRLVRPTAESSTASKAQTGTTVASKPTTIGHDVEKMQVDEPHDVGMAKAIAEEDDDVRRVFKKRHTDEKPIVHAKILDDSQVEADKVAAELVAVEGPSVVREWEDLDAEDWDDPIMVSEYVADVCVYFKEIELAAMPNPDYMNDQNEITWEHRGILIDWLLQVHARFNLLAESLFLCVNVLDRFLSLRPISISKLQLVGLASFFIATKFEETYAPSVKEIAHLADGQYSVEEILKAERYLLKIIGWDLRAPGPMGWLRRASKADECEVHARTVAKYLLEVGLVERRLINVVPSLMSAAALWFARLTLGREHWTPNLEHYTTYSEKEIIPVANIMLEYIITDPVQHESLYKKYSHKRYYRCSSYVRAWALDRWSENGTVNLAKDLPELKAEIQRLREEEGDD